MSNVRADDETRKKIMNELKNLGVLEGKNLESEFNEFLARRQAAIEYNKICPQSDAVKATSISSSASQAVFSYHDPAEYPKGITPQRYKTSLYRLSVNGGRVIQDATSSERTESPNPHPNPLGMVECPKSNISVATKQTFASSGGYFGKDSTENKPHKTASVLHAYAYEFENFTPTMIQQNKCPFIVTTQGKPAEKFPALPGGIDQKGAFAESGKDVTPLYLDVDKYKSFVRDNLLKQMRATYHAHAQSGMTDPLQLNLTLPGMGYFAKLGTKFSLTDVLAQAAADGYKEAMGQYSDEQNKQKRTPRIEAARLSYPADSVGGKSQREAIERAFGIQGDHSKKIGNITVRGTTNFPEELDGKKGITQVVCVNGDPRTYPGNEPGLKSQEPGIYSNIVGGRDVLSPVIHPFSAFSSTRHYSHASTQEPTKEVKLDSRVAQLEADLDKLQQQFQQKAQAKPEAKQPAPQAKTPELQRRAAQKEFDIQKTPQEIVDVQKDESLFLAQKGKKAPTAAASPLDISVLLAATGVGLNMSVLLAATGVAQPSPMTARTYNGKIWEKIKEMMPEAKSCVEHVMGRDVRVELTVDQAKKIDQMLGLKGVAIPDKQQRVSPEQSLEPNPPSPLKGR